MRCEVCGRKIREAPMRVIIEGAKLTVCTECSKHGKVAWEEPAKPTLTPQRQTATGQAKPIQGPIQIRKRVIKARVDTSQEIVEDYAEVIRDARKNAGLSHEDLGKKINEKESVLRKIETGKMKPNNLLVSKLEHNLKIKLLVPVSEEKVSLPKTASHEFTLGDAIKIGKKGKGE
ncbi:MAG: multiprotein bridging factor aMBF1 [Candidatus Bathyarchaeota archaeon]|nr:multiprotein bridging factor aMBF1 [Candidatus Bathyarchaeota archaeon]